MCTDRSALNHEDTPAFDRLLGKKPAPSKGVGTGGTACPDPGLGSAVASTGTNPRNFSGLHVNMGVVSLLGC